MRERSGEAVYSNWRIFSNGETKWAEVRFHSILLAFREKRGISPSVCGQEILEEIPRFARE